MNQVKAFKKDNIFHEGCFSMLEAILYDLKMNNKAKGFFSKPDRSYKGGRHKIS
jgi:hypothetical protein